MCVAVTACFVFIFSFKLTRFNAVLSTDAVSLVLGLAVGLLVLMC